MNAYGNRNTARSANRSQQERREEREREREEGAPEGDEADEDEDSQRPQREDSDSGDDAFNPAEVERRKKVAEELKKRQEVERALAKQKREEELVAEAEKLGVSVEELREQKRLLEEEAAAEEERKREQKQEALLQERLKFCEERGWELEELEEREEMAEEHGLTLEQLEEEMKKASFWEKLKGRGKKGGPRGRGAAKSVAKAKAKAAPLKKAAAGDGKGKGRPPRSPADGENDEDVEHFPGWATVEDGVNRSAGAKDALPTVGSIVSGGDAAEGRQHMEKQGSGAVEKNSSAADKLAAAANKFRDEFLQRALKKMKAAGKTGKLDLAALMREEEEAAARDREEGAGKQEAQKPPEDGTETATRFHQVMTQTQVARQAQRAIQQQQEERRLRLQQMQMMGLGDRLPTESEEAILDDKIKAHIKAKAEQKLAAAELVKKVSAGVPGTTAGAGGGKKTGVAETAAAAKAVKKKMDVKLLKGGAEADEENKDVGSASEDDSDADEDDSDSEDDDSDSDSDEDGEDAAVEKAAKKQKREEKGVPAAGGGGSDAGAEGENKNENDQAPDGAKNSGDEKDAPIPTRAIAYQSAKFDSTGAITKAPLINHDKVLLKTAMEGKEIGEHDNVFYDDLGNPVYYSEKTGMNALGKAHVGTVVMTDGYAFNPTAEEEEEEKYVASDAVLGSWAGALPEGAKRLNYKDREKLAKEALAQKWKEKMKKNEILAKEKAKAKKEKKARGEREQLASDESSEVSSDTSDEEEEELAAGAREMSKEDAIDPEAVAAAESEMRNAVDSFVNNAEFSISKPQVVSQLPFAFKPGGHPAGAAMQPPANQGQQPPRGDQLHQPPSFGVQQQSQLHQGSSPEFSKTNPTNTEDSSAVDQSDVNFQPVWRAKGATSWEEEKLRLEEEGRRKRMEILAGRMAKQKAEQEERERQMKAMMAQPVPKSAAVSLALKQARQRTVQVDDMAIVLDTGDANEDEALNKVHELQVSNLMMQQSYANVMESMTADEAPAVGFGGGLGHIATNEAPVYKTRMCRFLAEKGYCPHGDKCSFAHSVEELPPSYKRELCQAYMMLGVCQHGINCKFAHGREELRVRKAADGQPMEDPRQVAEAEPEIVCEDVTGFSGMAPATVQRAIPKVAAAPARSAPTVSADVMIRDPNLRGDASVTTIGIGRTRGEVVETIQEDEDVAGSASGTGSEIANAAAAAIGITEDEG
eukprot:g2018.t1